MVKFSRAPCGLTTLSKHSWLSFLKLDAKSPIQRVLRIPRTGLEEIWTQVGRPQVAWQNAGAIPNRTVCGPLDSCSKTLCIIASDWLMTWVNTLSMIVGLFLTPFEMMIPYDEHTVQTRCTGQLFQPCWPVVFADLNLYQINLGFVCCCGFIICFY